MSEEALDFTMGLDTGTDTSRMMVPERRALLMTAGQEPCKRCGEPLPHVMHRVLVNPLTGEEMPRAMLR